ncbi:hypothetical protein Tco_1167694 [Tanacetum coccineum]
MNLVAAQQVALENDLVAHKKRLKIEKCNARIEFSKPQRKTTYQVTLDALKLSPCYPAFLITAKVPKVYMHQFWNTIKKIKDTDAYQFKLDKKKFRIDTEGMFYQKNVDFVALLWENFMFQADNKEISFARKENMPYPRFTKAIISHFISKDKTISMRNQINLHIVRDDTLLGTLKFVSKTQDYQKYGTLIPEEMINQAIKDSKAYKTYLAYATGATTPKKARKFKKPASPSKKQTLVLEDKPAKKSKHADKFVPAQVDVSSKKPSRKKSGVVIRDTPGRNLKVHEMIIKKDSKIVKEKVKMKSIALKAKKESSNQECSTSGTKSTPWQGKEDDEKVKDETCLVAHASSEVCSESSYFSDENSSIDDLALDNEYDKLCKMSLKIITKNKMD